MLLRSASSRRASVRLYLVPLLAAAAAVLLGYVVPLASPLLVALVLGAIAGNTSRVPDQRQQVITKLLLRCGIVLLGLRLPLQDLAAIGVRGIVIIAATVLLTFSLTCYIGGRLGVDRGLVTLIASGFSICGASAIAAVESGIRRRDEDVALSVAMVTIFGTAMIAVIPLLGSAFGMSELQIGIWAGASIHEVAQVVAAASLCGAAAVAIATTVKLGRVALLGFAVIAARGRDRGAVGPVVGGSGPLVPWFVVGFAVAAGLRTTGILGAGLLDTTDLATTVLLAAGMYGLGSMLRMSALLPIPIRVFALAGISTAVAATVPGVLLAILY